MTGSSREKNTPGPLIAGAPALRQFDLGTSKPDIGTQTQRSAAGPAARDPQYMSEAPTQEPAVPASTMPTKRHLTLGVRQIGRRRNDDFARNGHEGAFQRHEARNEPIAALGEGRQDTNPKIGAVNRP